MQNNDIEEKSLQLTQEIRLFISQPPVDIHYPRSGLEAAAVEARVLKMKRDKKRYKMHWIEEKNVNQSVSSFKSKMRIRMHKELIGKLAITNTKASSTILREILK